MCNPFNLKDQTSPRWQARADIALALMQELGINATRIADLGCGNKRMLHILTERLPYRVTYQGYDLIPQEKDVITIDLNTSFPEQRYDLVFCLGLLEYLHDLDRFFGHLRQVTRYAIVSYVASDSKLYTERHRRGRGWVHNYSSSEIVSCFTGKGFNTLGQKIIDDGRTYIFAIENTRD